MSLRMNVLLFLSLIIFPFSTADFPLTILHTNDVHARFVSFNAQGRPCTEGDIAGNKCWGGAARRLTAMKKFAAEDQNVLKLDAGDQFQGTLWYTTLKWQPIAAYMNLMKYDAMAFGNHEFDDGMQGLEPFVRNMSTPIVNSNIKDNGSPIEGLYKQKIDISVGGQKIAIIGCTTVDVPIVADPGPQLEFRDEVEAVRQAVTQTKGNKIIVLSHAGIKVDRKICQQVDNVDIVVGGHSHSFLWTGKPPSTEIPEGPYPEVYKRGNHTCLVVQDYAYGKYLGRLKVVFDDKGELINWTGNPVLINAKEYPEDEEIVNLLRPYHADLERYQTEVAATTAVKLDGTRQSCRLKECNLGNILADAALYFYIRRELHDKLANRSRIKKNWSPAAISLWNAGGIRDYVANAGTNVTLEDLYTIMPFGNTIDKFSVKGIDLKNALEHSVGQYWDTIEDPPGIFLQVSGLKVVFDLSQPAGKRVKRVRVRCNDCGVPSYQPLDNEKMYDVVAPTYLANGGDGYTMLNTTQGSDGSNMLDVDVVLEYVTDHHPIISGEELRIEYQTGNGETTGIPPVKNPSSGTGKTRASRYARN